MNLRGIVRHPRLGTFGFICDSPTRFQVRIFISGDLSLVLGTMEVTDDRRYLLTTHWTLGIGELRIGPHDKIDECVSSAVACWKSRQQNWWARTPRGES